MEILDLRVMRGPNYWSDVHKKIIVLKLDLEDLEREPTHKIDGFSSRLKEAMPSLYTHKCTEGEEGGFFKVVEQGTWMAHVVEHIALELQCLAGMSCSFGKTLSGNTQGIYHVIFEYQDDEAGRYAGKAAVKIAVALAEGEDYDIGREIVHLEKLARRSKLGPSTSSLVEEARNRGIPVKKFNNSTLLVFGYGNKQKKISATVVSSTSGIGIEIARDKQDTKMILGDAYIPVPRGVLVHDEEDLEDHIEDVRYPLVIKPLNGNHGRGITTGIGNLVQAVSAFQLAKAVSLPVIMEEFVQGNDYRMILVDHKVIAVAKRTPAMVTGNGKSTIMELIEQINREPGRGNGHDDVLTKVVIDKSTEEILAAKDLHLDSVLEKGEILYLKHTANISTGGTSEDVTDIVHPSFNFIAERVSRLVDLNICGVDIVAKDITKPFTRENGAVVEVNAGPGLRMHQDPAKGLARNVARPIVEMLFPVHDNGRIPVVAITGTNGKTTTTRLVAHLAQHAGHHKVGFTTTDGIYIQGQPIYHGDCTGPVSAQSVLFDPFIDFAVLECARGGILRSGLAFDECDISIVTNVSEDHLNLKDINTLEEMANVKAVVPRTTRREGYAILNADDDLVYEMKQKLSCRIALFSMHSDNQRVKEHCENGGLAAVIENDYLTVCDGQWKTRIDKVKDIPLSLGGRAEAMIKNLLPAALVTHICGWEPERSRKAFQSFVPSPDQTPGRMNIFRFREFEIMVDYAHNVDGYKQLKIFLDKTNASVKVGIIGVAGDRRDDDIRGVGSMAAEIFDEIIVRHDEDMRGRPKEEMTELLLEGIRRVDPDKPVTVIESETEAILYSIGHAKKNAFITACSEKIHKSIETIKNALEKENTKTTNKKKVNTLTKQTTT